MLRTSFHKQTDPVKQAGQVKNEITLGDYLENKYPEEMKKKMTFDEWWESWYAPYPVGKMTLDEIAGIVWKVAQENK